MSDTELLTYLQRNARKKLEVAYNFYEQKYKAMCNHEHEQKEKSKAIGVALLTVAAIVFSIKFIIFMIKAFIIKSDMMDLPYTIFTNVELLGFIVGLTIILILLVYFGVIYGDYWYTTHKNATYMNEKNRYFSKAEKLHGMLKNIEELNEDDLNDIISKEIEDF